MSALRDDAYLDLILCRKRRLVVPEMSPYYVNMSFETLNSLPVIESIENSAWATPFIKNDKLIAVVHKQTWPANTEITKNRDCDILCLYSEHPIFIDYRIAGKLKIHCIKEPACIPMILCDYVITPIITSTGDIKVFNVFLKQSFRKTLLNHSARPLYPMHIFGQHFSFESNFLRTLKLTSDFSHFSKIISKIPPNIFSYEIPFPNSSSPLPTLPKRIMISGPMTMTQALFDEWYVPEIDKHISLGNKFIIGGAEGTDQMAQIYLKNKIKIDGQPGSNADEANKRVIICDRRSENGCLFDSFFHINGFDSFTQRDSFMTLESDEDIAFIFLTSGPGSGTAQNLIRRNFGKEIASDVTLIIREHPNDYEGILASRYGNTFFQQICWIFKNHMISLCDRKAISV